MGTFYTANEDFKTYLLANGFTFHDREEPEVCYYTHHATGNQVKVDTNINLVTLLDQNGSLVDSSSSFTDNQIQKFLGN